MPKSGQTVSVALARVRGNELVARHKPHRLPGQVGKFGASRRPLVLSDKARRCLNPSNPR